MVTLLWITITFVKSAYKYFFNAVKSTSIVLFNGPKLNIWYEICNVPKRWIGGSLLNFYISVIIQPQFNSR